MNDKIYIGIAGELAAGKDSVTRYLIDEYDAYQSRFSAILEDLLNRLYLPIERKNLADMAEAMRAKFSLDVLAQAVVRDGNKSEKKIIVADGIRKKEELQYLQSLPKFYLIFVDADIEKRYERITQRNEKADDATKTFEEFLADHNHSADNTTRQLKDEANFVIDNNGSLDDLKKKVDQIMKEVIGK